MNFYSHNIIEVILSQQIRIKSIVYFFLFIILLIPTSAVSKIIRVPDDYSTIQLAVDQSSDSDNILVANGTYKGSNNKNIECLGKSINIKSVTGPENCIIDCENDGLGFYLRGGKVTIDGFTVQNGNNEWGGGISLDGGKHTVNNCILQNNISSYGGGLYLGGFFDNYEIMNCKIISNKSNDYGGGIYIAPSPLLESSDVTISNCIISKNSVTNIGGGIYYAGTITFIGSFANPSDEPDTLPVFVNNCLISDNISENSGGGFCCTYSSKLIMDQCTIINNSSKWGGGISSANSFSIYKNCIIEHNRSNWGGGIYLIKGASPTFENCVIHHNTAKSGGNTVCSLASKSHFNNSTIVFSSSNINEIYGTENSTFYFQNSIVWGNSQTIIKLEDDSSYNSINSNIRGIEAKDGNVNSDPLFINFTNENYHLSDNSPCLGKGVSTNTPNTDIEGNPRPNPSNSNPDMGAYENSLGNAKPTISEISDQIIDENTQTEPITFIIDDVETHPDSLLISFNSSNPSLISEDNINLQGSGNNRTLILSPSENTYGKAIITVNVSDGIYTIFETFTIQVVEVKFPPFLSQIENVKIEEDGLEYTIDFTIVDADTPIENIEILINSSNIDLFEDISISGKYENRLIIFYLINNLNGQATITLTANDGYQSVSETFMVTVLPKNDPPIAHIQSLFSNEDSPFHIFLDSTDIDNDPLSYSILSKPSYGTLTQVNNSAEFIYTPDRNYYGFDVFSYSTSDGYSTSNKATVTIEIISVNDPPIALSQTVNIKEDVPIAITLLGQDIDSESLSFEIIDLPLHGQLSKSTPFLYTPNKNYFGDDFFTFRANDGNLFSQEATVNINITNDNDSPIAYSITVIVDEDGTKEIYLSATDIDNQTLTYYIVKQPIHGNIISNNQPIKYIPHKNYSGVDVFSFIAKDNDSISNEANVNIIINAINDEPIAYNQTIILEKDTSKNIKLQAEDFDNDSLTYIIETFPTHGSLSGNIPDLVYTPFPDYYGNDFMQFKVISLLDYSNTATIAFEIKYSHYQFHCKKGWALISIPLIPENNDLTEIFPNAEVAYIYIRGTYIQTNHLISGKGYWIKFSREQTVDIVGEPFSKFSIQVNPGWYLIGSIVKPVLPSVFPEQSIEAFYSFKDGTYIESKTFQPGKAYWVKFSKKCEFILK